MAAEWMRSEWCRLVTKRNESKRLETDEMREWELLCEIARLSRIKKRHEKTILRLDLELLHVKLDAAKRPTP